MSSKDANKTDFVEIRAPSEEILQNQEYWPKLCIIHHRKTGGSESEMSSPLNHSAIIYVE